MCTVCRGYGLTQHPCSLYVHLTDCVPCSPGASGVAGQVEESVSGQCWPGLDEQWWQGQRREGESSDIEGFSDSDQSSHMLSPSPSPPCDRPTEAVTPPSVPSFPQLQRASSSSSLSKYVSSLWAKRPVSSTPLLMHRHTTSEVSPWLIVMIMNI